MCLTILTEMFLAPCSHTLVLGPLKLGIFPSPANLSIHLHPPISVVTTGSSRSSSVLSCPTASFEPYIFKQKKSSKYRTPECRTTFLGTFCLMTSGDLFKVMKALYLSHMISCSVCYFPSIQDTWSSE